MRNKYDEKRGVCRIRWHEGAPSSQAFGPLLVETWKANVAAAPWNPVPRVAVHAVVEIRVRTNEGWHVLKPGGALRPVDDSGKEIRRYARLPGRSWWGNLTIDGWNEESRDD